MLCSVKEGDILKYKMIAMDMDGTLLNNSKEVSEFSKEVLDRAAEEGIKLVVCTGRIFTSARFYAKIIGTKAPIIASNGAYIREKDRDEAVFQRYLSGDCIEKVVDISIKHGLYPHAFTSDTIYTKKLLFFSANYTRWNESLPEEDRVKIELIENFDSMINGKENKILKVVVADDNIDKVKKAKEEIRNELDVAVFSSLDNNFEVMAPGVSKGSAVKMLADYYGISNDEIICFGDNENDKSMIQLAGLGIAMDNATDELKKVADYITDSNERDGVAKAIEKFVLNC